MHLHPTNLPLERKLPLVLAGLLATMLATSLAVTYRVLAVSAESARERLTSAAQTVAASAQQAVAERASQLQAAAAQPAIHGVLGAGVSASAAQREAARRVLEGLQREGPSQLSIELWDVDGVRQVQEGPRSTAETRPPLRGETVVHSPMYDDDGSVYAWTVAPVHGVGGLLGFIAAQVRAGVPPEVAQQVRGLTGGDVTMYLRNADRGLWVQHPGVAAAAPEDVREAHGALRHIRQGMGRMLAVEAPIAGTPWVVTLETPERLVLARANSTVKLLALVSLALLTIGTVLLWLFSRRFTRPLVLVTRAAEAIAAGDYGRRVAGGGGDELGRLATSFNQMAAEIDTSRRELIRRVHEAQEARLDAERQRAIADHARELAERASRARGDFLAVMSHELRTPLNAIGGYTQLLEMGIHGPVTAAQIEALRRITRNQEHLLTLINDVLNFAKLDIGQVKYTVKDIPVTEVFEELEPLINPQMQAHDLRFIEVKPDPTVTVRADHDKLQQILLNLLGNALKFTPAGGSITLASSAVDTVVQIHVRDTGIGIAPERLESIFDPFVQGDRALNRPVEGVGLGLAISRELARGMSGELVVQSTPGSGSVFTVMLPRGTPALRIAAAG